MERNLVTIDSSDVEVLLGDLSNFFSPSNQKRLLTEVASLARFLILERTAKGRDVDNKFFEPYSPTTVFFRQKKGRPTDKVDLFFSGRMLGSLTMTVASDWARLYFPPSEAKKAANHQYGIKAPVRRFFGLSASDLTKVSSLIDGEVDEVLRGRK